MKKNYRLLSLLFVIPLFLSGCQGNPGGGGSSGDQSQASGVTGVAIDKVDETTVLDGTRVSLKAKVSGDEGVSQKVKWSSSDDSVATVTNGVVNFLKVSEEKKVTITAAAQEDANFKDSVEFTVEHSPFDLKNSRGNPDTSLFFDDGSFIIEDPQDIALIYSDVHDTRWYVEATIIINDADPTDAYPKFGIMASERDDGFWTHEKSHQIFYYVDSVRDGNTWSNMNVVKENDTLDNWDWAGQLSPTTASPSVKRGEAFKMGLMRDGSNFYQFYGKASDLSLKMVGSFEYNSFGDQANYVWVGGWKEAAVVSDAKCMVGDEIDALYTIPEGLSLKSNEEILYLGETYKIEVTTEGLWDRNKLTFTSSDPTIATVDNKGVITASSEKAGNVTITVGLQGTELSADFALEVTDDEKFRVVLDGEMNDLIWSDKVKTNRYLLKKNDNNYVRIYGAKNSRGLYLFMDYVVAELANCTPDQWWTWENVEFKLGDDDQIWSSQYWVSSMGGGTFKSVGDVADFGYSGAGYSQKNEDVFYKALVKGEDNLYHGAFEMFVPYGDDQVSKNQATYALFGFAPKAGWQAGYNYRGNDGIGKPLDPNTLSITVDGFAHDGTSCDEGHAGAWITDQAATCAATGSAHRTCPFCGHRETKVLDVDPNNHAFDYDNVTALEHPTCIKNAKATCPDCGAIDEVFVPSLPLDHTNHAGTFTDGMYTCCHLNVENGQTLTLDNYNAGGWAEHETNLATGIEGTSWTYKYEYDLSTNGIHGSWWKGVLPFLKGADGDIAVARFDWWGWVDDRNGDGPSIAGSTGDRANNASMTVTFDWFNQREGGVSDDFETCMTSSHVQAVITRNGSNINSTFYIRTASIDFTYEYHYNLTGVTTNAVTIGITAEYGRAVVSNVYREA